MPVHIYIIFSSCKIMQNLLLSLLLSVNMFSCSAKSTENILKNGFYLGKIRRSIIFEYYVLIEIGDSTAIVNAFFHQKGLKTGYDMFAGIPKFYESSSENFKFPSSESFQFHKRDQNYIFYNSEHEIVACFDKGKLKILTPFEITLKYYDADPSNLYPSKLEVLRGCLFHNPYMLFENEEKPSEPCIKYINGRLLYEYYFNKEKIVNQMDYGEFYDLMKSKSLQYKKDYDNNLCSP